MQSRQPHHCWLTNLQDHINGVKPPWFQSIAFLRAVMASERLALGMTGSQTCRTPARCLSLQIAVRLPTEGDFQVRQAAIPLSQHLGKADSIRASDWQDSLVWTQLKGMADPISG